MDTGCSNTIIHSSVANKIDLTFKPNKVTLSTATGDAKNAVKGITHTDFTMLQIKNNRLHFVQQ